MHAHENDGRQRSRGVSGAARTDILSTMLGLSHTEIDGLYADGIVHRTDPFTEPQVAPANP